MPNTPHPSEVGVELEDEHHLDPWHAFDRTGVLRQVHDDGPVGGGRAGGDGGAGAGGHGGRRENRDEWDIE